MGVRILSPEAAKRMFELAATKSEYRPKEIRELKAQIEAETKALELRSTVPGAIKDLEEEVNKIVFMKLQLENLYADWVEGKIG